MLHPLGLGAHLGREQVGKNTDAGEGGGMLPMDSVKKMKSWTQAGAA